MKILITEEQYINLHEGVKKEYSPNDDESTNIRRYNNIADTIISYMDKIGLSTIPGYRFMAGGYGDKLFGVNMKTYLAKNLGLNEYDGHIKPLIVQKRPEFTYTTFAKLGSNNYLVEDGLAVKSLGEVIVYNTFKMNGITLEYETPSYKFPYLLKSKPARIIEKNPDFYYSGGGIFIEVAGFPNTSNLAKEYGLKLLSAKREVQKTEDDMIILDYHKYKNNLDKFFRVVCKTFGFDYNPSDFIKSIEHKGIDKDKIDSEIKRLLSIPNKKRGEQDRLNKLIKQVQSKSVNDTEGKGFGAYKNVWDYKRTTGAGLKWGDDEYRKKIQKAWCNCSGSVLQTMYKFKELYPDETFSKQTYEKIKTNFPNEFSAENRQEICN